MLVTWMISGGHELSHTLVIYALAIKPTWHRAIETIRLSTQQKDLMLSCVQSTIHISCEIHHANFFHFNLVCRWLHGTETACWIILSAYTWSVVPHFLIAHSGSPQILAKTTKPGRDPKRKIFSNNTTLPHLQSYIYFSNLEIQIAHAV